jgi:rare lipoprotein A
MTRHVSPRLLTALFALTLLLILAGCAGSGKQRGGYYKDDGPGDTIPANILAIPDAVPKIEPHARANMRPYEVFGKRYVPISDNRAFRQTGIASWYGRKFHGNSTANGETYDMYAMTAAHPTLPIPSYARVTRASNGRSIIVRINDRGPFHSARVIDLSYVAAAKLGLIGPGSGQVIVEAITHDEIRRNTWARAPSQQPTTVAVAATPEPPRATQAIVAAPASVPSQPAPAPAIPDALAALQHSTEPIYTEPAATSTMPGTTAPEPTRSADAIGPGQVYLQFGAFSSSAAAQSLAGRLNQQIIHSGLGQAQVELAQDQLYRVQIGPFPSRTAAVNAAVAIQEQTGMQPAMALR